MTTQTTAGNTNFTDAFIELKLFGFLFLWKLLELSFLKVFLLEEEILCSKMNYYGVILPW